MGGGTRDDYALINTSQITSIYVIKMHCRVRIKDGTIFKLYSNITLDDLYKEIMEL